MKKKFGQSLTKLADAAFKQAAKKVIERALATGTPVVVWQNGEIKELNPRTLKPKAKTRKRKTG